MTRRVVALMCRVVSIATATLLVGSVASAQNPVLPDNSVNAVTKLLDIEYQGISEMSGLVKSQQYEDVYWVHNDSGDSPRIFPINGEGKILFPAFLSGFYYAERTEPGKQQWPGLVIELAANIDWEDITIDHGNIYVADMGNNGNARRDLGVYVIPEPNPLATPRIRPLKFIPVKYPDQESFPPERWHFDSEAMFAFQGKLYFLTKFRGASIFDLEPGTNLYRLDSMSSDEINVLTKIDSHTDVLFPSAADLSPSGEWLAVLSYTALWIFSNPANEDNWLSGNARRIPLDIKFTRYVEAITWIDDNKLLIGNEDSEWFTVNLADIPEYDGQPGYVEGLKQFEEFRRSLLR